MLQEVVFCCASVLVSVLVAMFPLDSLERLDLRCRCRIVSLLTVRDLGSSSFGASADSGCAVFVSSAMTLEGRASIVSGSGRVEGVLRILHHHSSSWPRNCRLFFALHFYHIWSFGMMAGISTPSHSAGLV